MMDYRHWAIGDVLNCFEALIHDERDVHFLGEGGQARVYSFHDGRINPYTGRTIGPVAVKCYPREVLRKLSDKGEKRVLREIMNHRRLCHKHIVGFREVRLTQDYLAIALNYIQARWCFQQLMLAVDYLHKRHVANRDISLENILVDESTNDAGILLCDFGLSRSKVSIENNKTRSIVGKLGYVAPELMIRMDKKSFALAKAGDIYSCGVCLYKMLFGAGSHPLVIPDNLDGTGLQELVIKLVCSIEAPKIISDDLNCLSPECIAFLRGVLHTNPKQRFTMDEIWNNNWFVTNLPNNNARAYNDLVCSKDYIDENFSCLQSEPELQNKVQRACSDYRLTSSWE
eukprot:g8682.t1